MHTNDGAPHVLHSLAFRSKLLLCFQFKLPETLPLWWTFFLHLCVLLSLSQQLFRFSFRQKHRGSSSGQLFPALSFLFITRRKVSVSVGAHLSRAWYCPLLPPRTESERPLPKKRLNYWSLKFGRTNFQKLRESRLSTHAELHLRTHPREREIVSKNHGAATWCELHLHKLRPSQRRGDRIKVVTPAYRQDQRGEYREDFPHPSVTEATRD